MKKIILSALLVAASVAFAQFPSQNNTFTSEGPSLNRKVRNLGMGNVGVALKGTHGSSPFYNPAGLNDLDKGQFEFLAITGEVSKNAFDLFTDLKDLSDDLDAASTDSDKTNVIGDFVQANTGKFRRLRTTFDIFNYVRKNFAIGLLIDERIDLTVRNDVPESFYVRNLGDASLFISGAHGFWDGLLQVGVTLKPTLRFSLDEVDQQVDFTDTQDDASGELALNSQLKKIYKEKRFGLGVNLGLKSNLAFGELKDAKWFKALGPQFGVTWEDIGSTSFDSAQDNEQSINAGFAIHPDIWKIKSAFAIDVRDINREIPLLSKLHVGVESKLPWLLALRAGLNQGYFTAGASLDLWVMELEGAMYFEEIGTSVRQDGNLRYAFRLSFNI